MAKRKTERPDAARGRTVRVSYAEAGEALEDLLLRYFTALKRR